MSRIGKVPVAIAENVKVAINNNLVTVTGKLGSLSRVFPAEIKLVQEENSIQVQKTEDTLVAAARWGLSRTLLNNMIIGVSQGYEKKLEIIGVGYKAAVDDKYLTLYLGYSHEIKFEIPVGITIKAIKPTLLSIFGHDKQQVGQVAALLISQRPPEPYKGKGIKLEGQKIRRKEGKKK